jgi:hypothetical protein
VPAPTDDEVIVHRYAERSGGLDDVVGYGNVRSGRGRIARRMIMYEDQRRTCCDAWNWLLGQTGRIRSLCSYPWLERVSN